MNSKIFILLSIIAISSFSCQIDPYLSSVYTDETIWEYPDMVEGLVGKPYDYMSRNYNDNVGAILDGATDNAVMTSATNVMAKLATGSLVISQDPFSTYWNNAYKAIYSVNLFLKDRKGFNTRFVLIPAQDLQIRNRLQGEAFALRAWFEWDLLQKFGGKDVNGEMKGFPIVLEPLDITKKIDLARNSYDECVKQIVDDCDSAYKYLPIAHRDFLVTGSLTYAGSKYWGRMDGITTRAIKALVYLNWASPRFNSGGNIERWDSCAKYAKQVIDFKLNDKSAGKGFTTYLNRVNWFDLNFEGIIFSSRGSANDAMERMFYPGGFSGNGTMGATQELVDAFGMKDGYPLNQSPTIVFDPKNPYLNRDPRFYSIIFYNNLTINGGNPNTVGMYTFENWENGGKDAMNVSSTNSNTNYYIKKFVSSTVNFKNSPVNTQPHSKFFIRWAHMCLAFAEAANHVGGPNNTKYGLTPKAAISYLRQRKTYDNATGITVDPYLDKVASLGETAFDAFIKNERRIETCFEGTWFFDLRRWSTTLSELNKPVHGVKIVKNADNTFTYDFTYEVQKRQFSSAYLPIPYDDILNMSKLTQNEGWDSWK
ncbi:MAG: RagB/SusD family nutrient uptake outer membrane protein [Paludibacter sp.]|nr:RagB/SusD family nutrient uptake outer membrane protein [Paludibacter sp.]